MDTVGLIAWTSIFVLVIVLVLATQYGVERRKHDLEGRWFFTDHAAYEFKRYGVTNPYQEAQVWALESHDGKTFCHVLFPNGESHLIGAAWLIEADETPAVIQDKL